jgi:hypothetical protein
MKIHLHCVAWNEMRQLDYFFRHYDEFVSHYFVHDDASDDGTLDFLLNKDNVTVLTKINTHADSYVLNSLEVHNSSWRRSCGKADWVISVDMDEHIWHHDLITYIAQQQALGVTAIPALGFQMTSRVPPPQGVRLSNWLTIGAPWKQMSKLVLYRPDALTETNFTIGRHSALPKGQVVFPSEDELFLLHYKYLGLEQTQQRHAIADRRRRTLDRARNWGFRYAFDKDALREDFNNFEKQACDYRQMFDPHKVHTEPRWWR